MCTPTDLPMVGLPFRACINRWLTADEISQAPVAIFELLQFVQRLHLDLAEALARHP